LPAENGTRQWVLSAPEGASRPNVPFTYVEDLFARTRNLGQSSAARGIEIQTGLPRLVEVGALRHELAHQVLSRYSRGGTEFLYHNLNTFEVLEELAVHFYATQNPAKAFVHSLRYINVGKLAEEAAIAGGSVYVIYRVSNQTRNR
jgi:hypothetical protein